MNTISLTSNNSILQVFQIDISKPDYLLAENFANNMWANSKTGEWGKGLINSSKDPRKVERIGNLGELAFSKLFNIKPNFNYEEHGNDNDFLLLNKSVNIKTAASNYNQALIKAQSSSGHIFPLLNDIYVFAFLQSESTTNKTASIILVGYELKSNIIKLPLSPAIKGNHKNYSIPYNNLKPISKLYNAYLKHC